MSDAAREIERRLAGVTGPRDEAAILALLRDTEGLQALLGEVPVTAVIANVHDYPSGPKYRTELVELLAVERVHDLDPAGRAELVTVLQTGRTGGRDEAAIKSVLLATSGAELTELKDRIDAGGDHRDLLQLVEHDLDDRELVAEILEHFAREAAAAPPAGLKVLSDIDDTLFASLHDARFPRGLTYPGVLELYQALAPPPGPGRTNLAFLTARPWDRAGGVESHTRGALTARGVPDHVILSGSLRHLRSHRAMAEKKLANFEAYRALFPEYRFVFIGDSGQGDALLGEQMLDAHTDAVAGVFIHDVLEPATGPEARARHAEQGLFFFDTYAGAAVLAWERGLVDDAGLAAITAAVEARLDELDGPVVERLREDLARALSAAPERTP